MRRQLVEQARGGDRDAFATLATATGVVNVPTDTTWQYGDFVITITR